jgi:hypothetical protein
MFLTDTYHLGYDKHKDVAAATLYTHIKIHLLINTGGSL